MVGQIRNIPDGKHFGFITTNEGKDYFFHKDDYQGSWSELLKLYKKSGVTQFILVEFEPIQAPKGLRAEKVVKIN
jgi:cold shock CspA family protein